MPSCRADDSETDPDPVAADRPDNAALSIPRRRRFADVAERDPGQALLRSPLPPSPRKYEVVGIGAGAGVEKVKARRAERRATSPATPEVASKDTTAVVRNAWFFILLGRGERAEGKGRAAVGRREEAWDVSEQSRPKTLNAASATGQDAE